MFIHSTILSLKFCLVKNQVRSLQPQCCKKAIPYSQALQMRDIYSLEEDFQKKNFLAERTPQPLWLRCIQNATVGKTALDTFSRAEALTLRGDSRQNKRTPLVVSYHPSLPHLITLARESYLYSTLPIASNGPLQSPPL